MDPSTLKKRKTDENGTTIATTLDPTQTQTQTLIPQDIRKILDTIKPDHILDQLRDIVINASLRHVDVLDAVRSIADKDPAQRKLFIRGLGWDTTTEGLRTLFSTYGDLEEAVVILDKATGKSKGYGFITFKHIDGAMQALKEPSKKIDGRMTVTQLASMGVPGSTPANPPPADISLRKIYVWNVPPELATDRLLQHFASYGEIEEGPLGFDKQTGKSKGFALFVYKTAEAARNSLVDPTKVIDGYQVICKLANDGKKGKPMGPAVGVGVGAVQQVPTGTPAGAPSAVGVGAPTGEVAGDGHGLGHGVQPVPSAFASHYGPGGPHIGGPGGGISAYGPYGGAGHQGPGGLPHLQHHSSIGATGLSSLGSQVPSTLGGSAGYGAGLGGAYGGLGGGPGAGGYGGPPTGAYSGLGVGGSSLYRLPPTSGGPGGYGEGAHYSLSSSAFPGQLHPSSTSSPVPRVPPAGSMYPNLPSYY